MLSIFVDLYCWVGSPNWRSCSGTFSVSNEDCRNIFVCRELLDFVSHGLWDLETLVHLAGNLKFLRDQIGHITWQIQEDSARSSSHRHAVDKQVDLLVPLSRV